MAADARFWDGIADSYAAKPVDDPEAFDRKTAVTLAHLTSDATVLDIGCGTGSFALRLAPHVAQVHGLDVSGEMLRIARAKTAAADATNVQFHHGAFDGSFDAIPRGSLDMVCAYSLLHLVEDRGDALARIYGLLKPGGVFVSSTVCLGGSWMPYPLILGAMRLLGKAPMVRIFSVTDLRDGIAEAGFVGIDAPEVGASKDIAFFVATKPGLP